jgi:hypothetical protein
MASKLYNCCFLESELKCFRFLKYKHWFLFRYFLKIPALNKIENFKKIILAHINRISPSVRRIDRAVENDIKYFTSTNWVKICIILCEGLCVCVCIQNPITVEFTQ